MLFFKCLFNCYLLQCVSSIDFKGYNNIAGIVCFLRLLGIFYIILNVLYQVLFYRNEFFYLSLADFIICISNQASFLIVEI